MIPKPNISKGQIYRDKNTNGKYEITRVVKFEGMIEEIILQNVNNKSLEFYVSPFELRTNYELID